MSDDDIRVNIRTGTSERPPVYRPESIIPIILDVSIYGANPYHMPIDPDIDNWLENMFIPSMEQQGLERDDAVSLLLPRTFTFEPSHINENDCCSICQKTYSQGEDVAQLNCNHIFHTDCIKEWGKYKQECPQCRHTIEHVVEELENLD